MKYLAGLRVREDQFARLRQLCPADHEFPKDWAAWSALVTTANELAVTEQLDAKPLDLDIEHFEQWCRLVGIVPCIDALRAYAIVRRKSLDTSTT